MKKYGGMVIALFLFLHPQILFSETTAQSIKKTFDITPPWMNLLWRGGTSNLISPEEKTGPNLVLLCKQINYFFNLHKAFVQVTSSPELTWKIVGISEAYARDYFGREGKTLARGLLNVFLLPLEERISAGNCHGENGNIQLESWEDGPTIIGFLQYVFIASPPLSPSDMETTPETIGKILADDFRERMSYWQKSNVSDKKEVIQKILASADKCCKLLFDDLVPVNQKALFSKLLNE